MEADSNQSSPLNAESQELTDTLKNKSPFQIIRISKLQLVAGFLILILFFAFGLYLRIEALDAVQLNEWITRDFDRALNIVDGKYLSLAGPESNAGGRLPGPFMYLFLALPLLIHRSYDCLFIFGFMLNLVSIAALFFVVKRHFGNIVGGLSSILLCINIHHLSSVAFPINPAFIFPFIVLIFHFLLELCAGKKPMPFLLAILTISLSIQFHYSMATFYLTAILLFFVLKIRVDKKFILQFIIMLFLCFLPYSIYKYQTFEPANAGSAATFRKKPLTIENAVKIITFQNVVSRVVNSRSILESRFGEEFESVARRWEVAFRLGLSATLYFFVFYVFYKIRQEGIGRYKKEFALLLFFVSPVYIYGITRPFVQHYWYSLIFIIPIIVIVSWTLDFIFQRLKSTVTRSFFACIILVSTVFFAVDTYKTVQVATKGLKNELLGTAKFDYKNARNILFTLMKALKLSPDQFFSRVYFLDYHPASLNLLKFANKSSAQLFDKNIEQSNICYFIAEKDVLEKDTNATSKELNRQRLKNFISDSTIKILSQREIEFKGANASKFLKVLEYVPKNIQSCYQNMFNPFETKKDIRDLLVHVKSIDGNFKLVSEEEKYDLNSELEFYKGQFIILDREPQIPFRFTLTIKRENEGYSIKGEVDFYYFWGMENFRFQNMDIAITPANELKDQPRNYATPALRSLLNSELSYKGSLLSQNTLASSVNHLASYGHWNYNQFWYRYIFIPKSYKLIKDKFFIDLKWEIKSDKDRMSLFKMNKYLSALQLKKAVINFKDL
jgi:hypothetical protein